MSSQNKICFTSFMGISRSDMNKNVIDLINEFSEFSVCYDCDLISYHTISYCKKHYLCGTYNIKLLGKWEYKECDAQKINICHNQCGFVRCDCFRTFGTEDMFKICSSCNLSMCNICSGFCGKCELAFCVACYDKHKKPISRAWKRYGSDCKLIFLDDCFQCNPESKLKVFMNQAFSFLGKPKKN